MVDAREVHHRSIPGAHGIHDVHTVGGGGHRVFQWACREGSLKNRRYNVASCCCDVLGLELVFW